MTFDYLHVFARELEAINFRRQQLQNGAMPHARKAQRKASTEGAVAGAAPKSFLVPRADASIRPQPKGVARGNAPPEDSARGTIRTETASKLIGLAFSGGGIRSASLCLGVLQGLDAIAPEGKPQVLDAFDYLSTVSGGSYIGASVVAGLMEPDYSFPFASRLDEQETPEVQHLRDYSNFIAPHGLFDFVTGFALVLRGLLVNAIIILPLLLFLAAASVLFNPTVSDLAQPDLFGYPLDSIPLIQIPGLHEFTLTVNLAALFMLIAFFSAILSSWRLNNGSIHDRERLGQLLGGLLLVWLGVLFIEAQPYVLLGILNAVPGASTTTGPDHTVKDILGAISKVVPGLVAVLGPLAVALVGAGQKLANVAKATVGEASWKAFFAKHGSELAMWGAALIVPFILWAVYLYLTVWGIHDAAISPICSKQITPNWLVDLTHCTAAWLPPIFGRLGIVGTCYLGLSAILFVLCIFIGPNANSLHELYRDRLSRAFLFKRTHLTAKEDGVDPFDPNWVDERKLSSLKPTDDKGNFRPEAAYAPYILMNASINLQGSQELNKRGRNADTFLFSPLFIGSRCTGYAKTREIEKVAPSLGVATAIAISGAAASANMGRETIKILTFSLAMLNVRLGYWLFNPARLSALKSWSNRFLANLGTWFFAREAIGLLNNKDLNVYLTDGGHVENLGVYELLRRRCKVIVAVDMDMDPALTFPSLVNLEVMARIDLGVRLDLPWAQIQTSAVAVTGKDLHGKNGFPGSHGPHASIGRVLYDDDEEPGVIIFIKSCLSGDENDYVLDYKRRNETFPHETTLDQFFTEEQFEAYRSLGFHSVQRLLTGQDEFETLTEPPEGWRDSVTAALKLLNIPEDNIEKIGRSLPN